MMEKGKNWLLFYSPLVLIEQKDVFVHCTDTAVPDLLFLKIITV